MSLDRIARKVQYQSAKLEVIEVLFWHGKNDQPSLEIEMAYNMISTLRQNLFNASEACLDSPLETKILHATQLQEMLSSAINFLIQISNSLTSAERQVLILKELFINITSELIALSTEINNADSRIYSNDIFADQSAEEDYQISADLNPNKSEIDQKFRNLVNKCLGDTQKAERLIQYEHQRHPALDREGAIQAAIRRWESDNR